MLAKSHSRNLMFGISPRFCLFVFDVNQGNGVLSSRFCCMAPWIEGYSLDLPRAVKNFALEVGCGDVLGL